LNNNKNTCKDFENRKTRIMTTQKDLSQYLTKHACVVDTAVKVVGATDLECNFLWRSGRSKAGLFGISSRYMT
jgi:hypothetical protein